MLKHSINRKWRLRRKSVFNSDGTLSSFDQRHPCVFTLSTGRVGTETLAGLYSLAGNIIAYHEPRPLLFKLSKLSYEYSGNSDARLILNEAFKLARADLLSHSLDRKKGYIETSPQATFLAPIILDIIPNARFIHLVRNPKDVVRSGMRRKWYAGHRFDNFRLGPLSNSSIAPSWNNYDPFKKNLWLWAETNRWIADFCATVPADRTLLLHSEDIFGNDEEAVSKLFTFIGAPAQRKRTISRVLGKKFNAQETGHFPPPDQWTGEMKKTLIDLTGEVAHQLGYKLTS